MPELTPEYDAMEDQIQRDIDKKEIRSQLNYEDKFSLLPRHYPRGVVSIDADS